MCRCFSLGDGTLPGRLCIVAVSLSAVVCAAVVTYLPACTTFAAAQSPLLGAPATDEFANHNKSRLGTFYCWRRSFGETQACNHFADTLRLLTSARFVTTNRSACMCVPGSDCLAG